MPVSPGLCTPIANKRPVRVFREFHRDEETGRITVGLLRLVALNNRDIFRNVAEVWLRDVSCHVNFRQRQKMLATGDRTAHACFVGTPFVPSPKHIYAWGVPVTYNPHVHQDFMAAVTDSGMPVKRPLVGAAFLNIHVDGANDHQSITAYKPVFR